MMTHGLLLLLASAAAGESLKFNVLLNAKLTERGYNMQKFQAPV